MALPDPEPGLVICYEYLWRRQQAQGATEAEKARPAVIVDEVNYFHWPNDLAQVPHAPKGRFHCGFVPPKLFEKIKQAIVHNHAAGNLAKVKRQP